MARAAVGLFLLIPGIEKFTSESDWVSMFARIGWGQWFRVFTGILEVVGAVLFVVPKLMWLGAALMITVMLGAIAAHLFVLGDPASSVVVILIAVIVAVYNKSRVEDDKVIGLRLDSSGGE